MRRAPAFTIVELLVVITVIAVLVAIVMPVLDRVRNSAYQATCLSNMRQLGGASFEYTADNSGQLPFCNWQGGGPQATATYGHGWLYSTVAYRTSFPAQLDGNWTWPNYPETGAQTGVLWPYIQKLAIYHCPLDQPEFYIGTNHLTSYLYNGAQVGFSDGPGMGAPLRKFLNPGNSVMYWESEEQTYEGTVAPTGWNDGSSYPPDETLADRHFKGANVCCFDRHVEWWDQGTWSYNVYPPTGGRSRLWCSPYNTSGH